MMFRKACIQHAAKPLGTACPLHDAQNALKWSVSDLSKGTVLHDTHVVIESCRNSMAQLLGHVGLFITRYVQHDPAEYDPEAVRMFWNVLGVGVDLLDLLVELNPVWKIAFFGYL